MVNEHEVLLPVTDEHPDLTTALIEQNEVVPGSAADFRPVLYKFTNAAESPHLDDLLALFYRGVLANSIGIMAAWNLDTEQEELILVGVALDEDGKADCYPLAKCLSVEETRSFLAPDGQGGYYDPADLTAAATAKEGMKSYTEAVVE